MKHLYTVKKDLKSKKGTEIRKGEKVEVLFNARAKGSEEFLPGYISLNTSDGRRIVTRQFSVVGIRTPSEKKLSEWSFDGICESVFGEMVEPDGWSHDGSPSWLLALGLI